MLLAIVVATAQSYRKKPRISIFVTLQEEWSVIVYNELTWNQLDTPNLPCIPDIRKSHHVVVISWPLGVNFTWKISKTTKISVTKMFIGWKFEMNGVKFAKVKG